MNTASHRKQQITLPGLSFKHRNFAYVQILSKMTKSVRGDEAEGDERAATVCTVLNLKDGKRYRLICPAIMVSSLNDEGEDYVGKAYEITVSSEPVPGKRYKNVEVYEIDGSLDYTNYPETFANDEETVKPEEAPQGT